MQNNPSISLSIAVVCYHSERELPQLLSSLLASVRKLREQYSYVELPIFLIDNSETGNLSSELLVSFAEEIADLNCDIQFIQGQGNIGYGSAHNLLLNKIGSDFHLLLNPDVVLDADTLVTGINYLKFNSEVALASPRVDDGEGNKQFLCKRYPSVLTLFVRGFLPAAMQKLFNTRLARYEMRDLSDNEANKEIPIVSGCCILCRSDAFKKVNGFDENYFLYFEDFDLSLRIGKEHSVAYVPAMRIRHGGGYAAKKGWAHVKMFIRSAMRFFNTHGWRWF